MNYTPPPGFVDQPYFWCFDTDSIADGSTLLNQAINLPGGYDFILRRITGLESVLDSTTGEWNFRPGPGPRSFASEYMNSPEKWNDRLIVPECTYPETSAINFDLLHTQCESITVGGQTIKYGQVAFQGVRRRRGHSNLFYGRKFRRVPYQITMPILLDWSYGSAQPVRKFSQQVSNFDFEAHTIYWTVDTPGSQLFAIAETAEMLVTAILNPDNPATVTLNFVVAGNNTPLSVSVAGSTITVNISTDGGGVATATYETVSAALLASAAAMALITVSTTILLPNTLFGYVGSYPLLGSSAGAPLSNITPTYGAVAKFVLYDYANNGLMPVPMRIQYLNEPLPYGLVATYKSGALVPPLVYPKDASISVDLTSLKPTSLDSIQLNLVMVGMQRIPC
jgi:hypothetical protein